MRKLQQPPAPEPEKFECWTAQRKFAIILEVLKGQISVPEASRRYGFTQGEYRKWVDEFMRGRCRRALPDHSGKNFSPHVTIGLAPENYLKGMLAEPFDEFTFSPAAVSVYQLGNYGVAAKKLKGWSLNG